jgi:uncharacterized flavoprotein (TIGR03862 family)
VAFRSNAVNELREVDVVVVGGGPAGLRAAEVASFHGARVALFDSNPFVGRKFLVAGKGGLNLTHGEDLSRFVRRYRTSTDHPLDPDEQTVELWNSLLRDFSPHDLRGWAAGLGVETFQASTGRVYPKALRAAQLLRNWIRRLLDSGVSFHLRHTLASVKTSTGFQSEFALPDGTRHRYESKAVILALGGASWPRTGSNAQWVPIATALGIPVTQFAPANCGWQCDWPAEVLQKCEGKPLKNIRATSGGCSIRGELVITRYGLEGGAVYALSHILRHQTPARLTLDFKPDSSPESLLRRLGSARNDFFSEACARWRLDPTTQTLLRHALPQPAALSAEDTVNAVKNFPILLQNPRPIAEAISTAGGVRMDTLNSSLMARETAGLFFAGEMLDWEAPTGGYLLQGCFSTGTRAGKAAAEWALKKY